MSYAPIVLFAFNRMDSLKMTIESLLANSESSLSDLYVFVDGPRKGKNEEGKVNAVCEYVKALKGFNSVTYFFSETNRGLGPSVIAGITEVLNTNEQVIVLEDDLCLSSNFLAFMNDSLNKYKEEKKVFSICGYSNKVSKPQDYVYDCYFCTRSSSWGWATWKDRWETVDWQLAKWKDFRKEKSGFNKWGGSDCFGMLEDWHNGKNQSWAIRFCFSQYLQNKLSLFPIISKVKNNGFDGNGTNCKRYSRFISDFDDAGSKYFYYPIKLELNEKLCKSAMKYNSLCKRIWSRIMYVIYS